MTNTTPTILETKMHNDSQKAVIESKKKEFEEEWGKWIKQMAKTSDYEGNENEDVEELWNWIITNFQPKNKK